MTQFLSFQAQSAPQGNVSSTGGGAFFANSSSALGASGGASGENANATSSVALNALAGDEQTFANLLNTQTTETAEVVTAAATQPRLAAFISTDVVISPFENQLDVLPETQPLELASNFAENSDLTLNLNGAVLDDLIIQNTESVEGNELLPVDLLQGLNEVEAGIEERATAEISNNEPDVALLTDSASIPETPLLGAFTLPQLSGQRISTEGTVRAAFGPEPLNVQPSNLNDGDLGADDLGPIPPNLPTGTNALNTGPNADLNTASESLEGFSLSNTVDLLDVIVPAGLSQVDAPTPNTNAAVTQVAVTNGNANIVLPETLIGASTVLPDGRVQNIEPSSFNNVQVAAGAVNQNSIQQALNNQAGLNPPVQATNSSAQPSLSPLPTGEQNLNQLNGEQADRLTQRVEQTLPRQAGIALNIPAQAETLPANFNQGAFAPANGLAAGGGQFNPNAADGINPAYLAQASQLTESPENQGLNFSANSAVETSASTNNANSLSNISQIAQLLGQPSGNETQLANIQTNNQPTIQLSTNGTAASAGSQTTAQLTPSFFTNETLPALSAQLSRGVVGGRDSFNVQLNPSELGRVDVRLFTNDDGSVNARVLVERVDTLDLFQRDLRALERSLLQSGIKLSQEGIDLSLKDNGANGNGNNAATNGEFTGNEDQRGSEETQRLEEEGNRALNDRLLVEDIEANLPSDVIQTIYARFTPGQLNIEV
ncbi:MAG: flagellar hook-length control protein FliK [Hyphomicrobiales bacterium]